jgi:hypothetical protein
VPSPAAQEYRGPIIPRGPSIAQTSIVRIITYSTVLTSTAGGVLSIAYTSLPTGSADWSLLAGLYQEFRTLAYQVDYVPYNVNYINSATLAPKAQAPLCAGINRTGAATPTTLALALQLEGGRISNTGCRWTIQVRASGSNEMAFQPVASGVSTSQVNSYADALDPSVAYAIGIIRWRVEFRSAF